MTSSLGGFRLPAWAPYLVVMGVAGVIGGVVAAGVVSVLESRWGR